MHTVTAPLDVNMFAKTIAALVAGTMQRDMEPVKVAANVLHWTLNYPNLVASGQVGRISDAPSAEQDAATGMLVAEASKWDDEAENALVYAQRLPADRIAAIVGAGGIWAKMIWNADVLPFAPGDKERLLDALRGESR